jgi:beta-galactosidase/beta-glucuronidase
MRRSSLGIALLAALPVMAADWKPAENTLTTPWTAEVRADNALPEYPRPQMVRPQWTNLNGLWDYAVLPKDQAAPKAFEGAILVPFPIESALSGVKRAVTPEQQLWYRRAFTAPDLKGGRLLLHFGAVDWRARVFLNGVAVGEHEGGYDPFTFDVTKALKPGAAQELVVAVWDGTNTGLQPRGKQTLKPESIWYTAVTGIWQTVWLEPVPAAYIHGLSMVPDVDRGRLNLRVETPAAGPFTAVARLRGKEVGRVSGAANAAAAIQIEKPELWSPASPTLYDLEVTLASGDSVKSYFGMRKIEVRKDSAGFNRLFLNNAALFQIGPLDQGWWPDGLYTAPTDEALRGDIETLKKLGFNMMRKHVKVEPARFYYWCDRLGLMVWQDMPSAMNNDASAHAAKGKDEDGVFPPAAAASFERELRAIMRALRNAPSIVAWVPFNEGWGQHETNTVLDMARLLDPSRLVNGPSGWEDRGSGDMKDMHEYPGPNMFPPVDARASVLGEFGGLGFPMEGHLWWTDKRNWGYRTFKTLPELQAGYEDLITKLIPLASKGLAAAVYTQTTDVEGEVNGLMTYDRKVVKYDAAKLAEMHRKVIEAGSGR